MGCRVIAELGINHNGDPELAMRMASVARESGADAVKFQSGHPELWIPESQQGTRRAMPEGGELRYADYRRRLEFSGKDWRRIVRHCEREAVPWFSSVMDPVALEVMEGLGCPEYKIPSSKSQDFELIEACARTGKPVILSLGMNSEAEARSAVAHLLVHCDQPTLMHCVSAYPMPNDQANLLWMVRLTQQWVGVPVGWSGHERGYQITLAAVALGACVVERHFSLDRTLPGTDQAASLEPGGFTKMVRDIRIVEQALGDGGERRLLDCEVAARLKMRGA
jgi:N-acetylneuraminate synthase